MTNTGVITKGSKEDYLATDDLEPLFFPIKKDLSVGYKIGDHTEWEQYKKKWAIIKKIINEDLDNRN